MLWQLARHVGKIASPVRKAVLVILDTTRHGSRQWSPHPPVFALSAFGFLVLLIALVELAPACSRPGFVHESQMTFAGLSGSRSGVVRTEVGEEKHLLSIAGQRETPVVFSTSTATATAIATATSAVTATAAPAPPTPTIEAPPPGTVVSRGTDTGTSLPVSTLPATGAVRILMYHYIRDDVPASDQLGRNLSISLSDFEAQMGFISARGFVTVSLDDLVRARAEGATLPPKAIVLTFDDGYADFYTSARPVLQRHGLRATVYVISGFVGRPAYLNWAQIKEMADAGFEIGSHTVNHPRLTGLTDQALSQELSSSRQQIEAVLGRSVSHFCYPSGAYDQRVRSATAASGYLTATTTQSGIATAASDPLALPRLRISGGITLRQFAAILGEPAPDS